VQDDEHVRPFNHAYSLQPSIYTLFQRTVPKTFCHSNFHSIDFSGHRNIT
jgi:hypothetical protein